MRTAELWDGRLSKAYTGPEDPRFREDTLVSIMERQKAEAAFGFAWARPGFRDDAWYQLCEAFLIHRDSTSREAAAAVLQRGRPRARELAVLAEVLGRDRESRRQTGTSPEEAVSQAFEEEWRKLERLKAEGARGLALALPQRGAGILLPPGPASVSMHACSGKASQHPCRHASMPAAREEGSVMALVALGACTQACVLPACPWLRVHACSVDHGT